MHAWSRQALDRSWMRSPYSREIQPGTAKRHVIPLLLDEKGVDVLEKIKAGSNKLRVKAKPGEFELWQEALEAVQVPTGWRQDQMSGYISLSLLPACP